jgi:DNA primase
MPDTQVEEVKSKVDIVAFINEKVPLKKAGRNFKGLCPFHGEKTPSFFVSPDMQYYKCFGCGAAGDVISFVMQFDGLTFPEALEQLAERVGVRLTKTEATSGEKQRQQVLELLHITSEYYHYLLTTHPVGKKALAYLKDRGVSKQSMSDFKLGYSLDSWDGLQQFLIGKKQFRLAELEAAGMIIRSDRGSYYDRFRGRIMFPQFSYAGKVVGFSGRSLDKEAKEAKYINSPETDYYHKSEILFGLNLAKKTIRDKQRIILMEGELDVISSHQIGLKEAVAIKGSAVTAEQASLIRRLTHNLILALDADTAGQEAMKRGIAVCETQALNLRVVEFSGGKDPDEVARSNPKELKQAVNNAEAVYTYLIHLATRKYDISEGEGKKLAAAEVMPDLAKIENAVEKEYYINLLANQLHVSQSALFQELQKARNMRFSEENSKTKSEKLAKYGRRELLERQLLGLVMQLESPKTEMELINQAWFSQPHLKRLHQSLLTTVKSVHQRGVDIVKQLPESIQPLAHEVYTMRAEWLELSDVEIASLFAESREQLEQVWTKQRLVEISKQMAEMVPKTEEAEALQEEYRRLAAVNKRAETGRDEGASV